jgi:ligand-binding sensor domain-containing protein
MLNGKAQTHLDAREGCEAAEGLRASRVRRFAKSKRARLWAAAWVSLLVAGVVLVSAWRVWEQAAHRLDAERRAERARGVVPFTRTRRDAITRAGLRLQQSTREVRALVRFRDSYFAATGGGLVEFSPEGEVLRRYSVLEGLPESDLLSLASYGARLYIGTRHRGLVVFDGESFESLDWPDRAPQQVSALRADEGKLLVGTFAGGLLEFDGTRFRELTAGAEHARLRGITCLERFGQRLYAGTFDDGLWIAEAGRWSHYTSTDGLQSQRIVGVVEMSGQVFVASDFALVTAPAGALTNVNGASEKFRAVATLPALNSLATFGAQLLAAQDDGDIHVFDIRDAALPRLRDIVVAPDDASQTASRLSASDGELWLLSSAGIRRAQRGAGGASPVPVFVDFGGLREGNTLASNLISALAHDAEGNLWVGSFRDGIDVFHATGRKIAHLNDAREINALVPDAARGTINAATSEGLLRYDGARRVERLTRAEGLAGDSVMHLAFAGQTTPRVIPAVFEQARADQTRAGKTRTRDDAQTDAAQLFVATGRGLSFGARGGWRTLTTVQGLPSNSVYAVLADGADSFYAGTLGGLAHIVSGRVARVFKDANSNLKHNWVTALCRTQASLFVGTYGGGVYELTAAGELRAFAAEMGRVFVNPNAMWCDDERVYAGTLEGVRVFELRAQRWTHLRDELPAPVVLSITGRDGHVWFGTTGGIAHIAPEFWRQGREVN